MNCTLCTEPIDMEAVDHCLSGFYVVEVNPLTHRIAHMHYSCYDVAMQSLSSEERNALEEFIISKEIA